MARTTARHRIAAAAGDPPTWGARGKRITRAKKRWGSNDEENVPTAQHAEKKNARLQEENENKERKTGVKEKEGKGAQAPCGMTPIGSR